MKVKVLFPVLVVTVISFLTLWITNNINQSMSEKMAYEILLNQPQEVQSYCLEFIAKQPPSNSLISKLTRAGINPSACKGDRVWAVNIGKFHRTGFNKIKTNYSYHCGMLCAASSVCTLKEKFGGKIEFVGCKLEWVS